jgi:hypothetical protein
LVLNLASQIDRAENDGSPAQTPSAEEDRRILERALVRQQRRSDTSTKEERSHDR